MGEVNLERWMSFLKTAVRPADQVPVPTQAGPSSPEKQISLFGNEGLLIHRKSRPAQVSLIRKVLPGVCSLCLWEIRKYCSPMYLFLYHTVLFLWYPPRYQLLQPSPHAGDGCEPCTADHPGKRQLLCEASCQNSAAGVLQLLTLHFCLGSRNSRFLPRLLLRSKNWIATTTAVHQPTLTASTNCRMGVSSHIYSVCMLATR